MSTLYLTPEQNLWCASDSGNGITCLLPGDDRLSVEHIESAQHGSVGLVFDQTAAPAPGLEALSLRPLFDRLSPAEYAMAVNAVPLAEWRRTNRYCGVCTTPLKRDPLERALVCPACAHRVYPRINPVVIVRITRGDELLLARRAGGTFSFFSIIAGFVEVGESLEEAVRREVMEEVGITIRSIRYHHSQPWSFPNNLMVGFTAEYADGEVRPDGVEMSEAGWYRRDNLPALPGPISIARHLIDDWLATAPTRDRPSF